MRDTDSFQDKALALIQYAILAPSSHNTQPWRFRVRNSTIDLFGDRTRRLPINDPDDRELMISCGCALMNLRIAAASKGITTDVKLFPDSENPNWLAQVSLKEELNTPLPEAELFPFLERRRTYRQDFAPKAIDENILNALVHAANVENAWLRPLLHEDSRRKAAALVAQGDAIQWANPHWRQELADWMHPRSQGDGLTMPGLVAPVASFVVPRLNLGGRVGAKDQELAEKSSFLAVLGTDEDSPSNWLKVGQALDRVLLTACQLGLQASYLNQPIQVGELRSQLQNLLDGDGFPQIFLRFGYPTKDIPQAPRRSLEQVLD